MSNHENPKDLKSERKKIVGMVEGKEQLKDETLDESKVQDEAEDLEPSEFTSGTDAMADGNAEADPEIDQSSASTRFSKKHELDEKELRKNKGIKDIKSGGGCK